MGKCFFYLMKKSMNTKLSRTIVVHLLHRFLRAEGCGAILLKRTSDVGQNSAYASILGASVMSDGTSASITAPNGSSQEQLIKRALEASGIKPNDVDYVEAHGTGTALGDPVEVEALAEVFAESRHESHPLMIGSVKSNIGHLEGAAGIAGLIKAILVLAHECVPPNAALETLNPLIEKTIQSHGFAVKFPTEVEPIVKSEIVDDGKLLVAGVSSFGYSGTIAHAIIQQAPLNIRRSINQAGNDSLANKEPGVGFLFTGQGSQYAGMGKELYSENEAFRQAMDQCNSIYKSLTDGESLLDTIFNNEDGESSVTRIAQPALVALEWSLAQMWQTHGVAPSIVLGHSVGEVSHSYQCCSRGSHASVLFCRYPHLSWYLPSFVHLDCSCLCGWCNDHRDSIGAGGCKGQVGAPNAEQ